MNSTYPFNCCRRLNIRPGDYLPLILITAASLSACDEQSQTLAETSVLSDQDSNPTEIINSNQTKSSSNQYLAIGFVTTDYSPRESSETDHYLMRYSAVYVQGID